MQDTRVPLLAKAAQELGSAFYAYDLDFLDQHLGQLRSQVKGLGLELFYACKANGLSSILQLMVKNGIGLDVASSGELYQARKVECPGENILTTGPAKSPAFLEDLFQAGVKTFVIESKNQLEWLNSIGKEHNCQIDILLRAQLGWEKGEKSVLGGSQVTPFGFGEQELRDLDLGPYSNLKLKGMHLFQWGNVLDPNKLLRIWEETFERLTQIAQTKNWNIEVIDVGGGLGIPYSGQPSLQFAPLMQQLDQLRLKYGLKKIWLELGRYAVGECGSYLCLVIDRKQNRGQTQLILEGGMNHQIRKALTGESFPAQALRSASQKTEKVHLYGPLCTSLDHLGEYELSTDIQPGDWIKFDYMGAYGFSESMPYFLGHKTAWEICLQADSYQVKREAQKPEQYLR